MSYKIDNIMSQVEFKDGIITSKSSGKEYNVENFVRQITDKMKLTRKESIELQSKFTDFILPQSDKSKHIEDLIAKYDFQFTDGVYFVRGKTISIEDIYRLMWKEERLLPTEVDFIIENIEKISEEKDLKYGIYEHEILGKLKQNSGKSLYLESLYTIYPDIKWRELLHNIIVPDTKPLFHIFYDDGVGGTGKSTLLEVLTKIVGEAFTSNVLLDQFGNRFIFANMLGKYFNIGDDNGKNDELQNVGTLKSIITGGRVTIDRKNISPIECRIFAKQLLATNILPYIDFTDGGIMRRLNIVSMNKVIPKNAVMPIINEAEISAILKEVIYADDLKDNNNELAITSSPLYRFYQTEKIQTYEKYKLFCQDNGFRSMNIINFEVKSKFIKSYIGRKGIEINKQEEIPF